MKIEEILIAQAVMQGAHLDDAQAHLLCLARTHAMGGLQCLVNRPRCPNERRHPVSTADDGV